MTDPLRTPVEMALDDSTDERELLARTVVQESIRSWRRDVFVGLLSLVLFGVSLFVASQLVQAAHRAVDGVNEALNTQGKAIGSAVSKLTEAEVVIVGNSKRIEELKDAVAEIEVTDHSEELDQIRRELGLTKETVSKLESSLRKTSSAVEDNYVELDRRMQLLGEELATSVAGLIEEAAAREEQMNRVETALARHIKGRPVRVEAKPQ